MKVHRELYNRWDKYVRLFMADCGTQPQDVRAPFAAWAVAYLVDIPEEAYHVGLNDRHIETALRRIFPNAWPKGTRK